MGRRWREGRCRGRALKGPGTVRETCQGKMCMEGAAGQGERELRVQDPVKAGAVPYASLEDPSTKLLGSGPLYSDMEILKAR